MGLATWLSMQMSLFGEEPFGHFAAPVSPKVAPPLKRPKAGRREPGRLPVPAAPQALFSGDMVAAPTQDFLHPLANRSVRISGHKVGFVFKRAKRKSIGFMVGPDGLVVSAPRWVLLSDVDAAVQGKSDWILRKLGETRARADRVEAQRIDWKDGCELPFLGQTLTLILDPSHAFDGSAVLGTAHQAADAGDAGTTETPRQTLTVGLSHLATPEQIRDAVQAWLMRQAKRLFLERLDFYAPQLNVRYSKLSLSSAGTRWGSASSNGSIRLNWRLIHFRLSTIDYVVVHELSHLRVMNHSPRFWQVVGSVLPDYELQRLALKSDHSPRWD